MLCIDFYFMNKKSGFNNNFYEKKELEIYVDFLIIWYFLINVVMYFILMNIRFLRLIGY